VGGVGSMVFGGEWPPGDRGVWLCDDGMGGMGGGDGYGGGVMCRLSLGVGWLGAYVILIYYGDSGMVVLVAYDGWYLMN